MQKKVLLLLLGLVAGLTNAFFTPYSYSEADILEDEMDLMSFMNELEMDELAEENKEWPKVKFPFNFMLNFKVYTYDKEKHVLNPWKNTTINQKVDSDGNRVLSLVKCSCKGKMNTIAMFVDYSTGKLVVKMPDTEYCKEKSVGRKLKIRNWIKKVLDPKGGITKYFGKKSLPWYETGDVHHFQVKIETKKGTKMTNLYYDTKRLDLSFVTLEGCPLIYQTNGFKEQKWRDKDFEGYTSCEDELDEELPETFF